MNKYQEGKIYKIVCNVSGEEYYGSTIEKLYKRLSKHKNDKRCLSRNIINRGDYKIELIKNYPCSSKKELEEEESKYIRENKCINIKIPNRTKQEYREDNSEFFKNYYIKYRKQYYENNKQELNKKAKEKLTCECGALVRINNLARHKKTLKHLQKTECLIID
jgi:hypothetical protein